jgi:hypothetical protein
MFIICISEIIQVTKGHVLASPIVEERTALLKDDCVKMLNRYYSS